MAGHDEVVVPLPRKKIATYGKAVRRRIPEQNFARFRQSQSPEKKMVPIPSRSPSVAPSEPMRLKSPKKRPSPSTASAVKANVFDVPSSDDESVTATAPTKARKPAPKIMAKTKVQKLTGKVATSIEDAGRRKRVKLSPAVVEVEKPVAVRASVKTTLPPKKVLYKSVEGGETKVMTSRPKASSVVDRKPERLRTPQVRATSTKDDISCSTSPLHSDTDMMDVDTPIRHISPRGQQLWKEVLDTSDNDGADSSTVNTTVSNRPNQILRQI